MARAILRIATNDPSSPKDIPLSSLIGNDQQTAECPSGYAGDPVIIAQGDVTDQTLAEANATALAAAQASLECELACSFDDPREDFPDFDSLINDVAITPVDQYGQIGFDAVAENPAAEPLTTVPWSVCPNVDWCDGPEFEGSVQTIIYTFRWRVLYNPLNGLVSYNRAGETPVQAPLDLFPAALLPDTQYPDWSLCFDANARPVFVFSNTATGEVNLRRYIGGTPTFFTWTGESPKVIYNGQMQRNDQLRDIVCYYLRAGLLYARFQRDNFGTEYLIADLTGSFGAMTRLAKTDRNIPEGEPLPLGDPRNPIYHFLFAMAGETEIALRAGPYQAWGFPFDDAGTLTVSFPSGAYYEAGFSDSGSLHAEWPSGLYFDTVSAGGSYADKGSLAAGFQSGAYEEMIVSGGSYADGGSLSTGFQSGSYVQTIVPGGSYSDNGSLSTAFPSGSYA